MLILRVHAETERSVEIVSQKPGPQESPAGWESNTGAQQVQLARTFVSLDCAKINFQ